MLLSPSARSSSTYNERANKVAWTEARDHWWHEEILKVPNYCVPEIMASEDPRFILYVRLQTSGSTGKPKGVVHTTGGYLLCAALH